MDEANSQRKRIAVACGRCRQRKIRCSGDNGTGEGCTNCKSAGFEPCQFLRVSSQEVQGVRSSGLNYNISVSRKCSGRNSVASPVLPSSSLYTHTMLGSVGQESLGGQGDMAYGCGTKQYHQGPEWSNGYGGDQSMDYAASTQAAPSSDHHYILGQYRSGSNPMVVRSNSLVYMDAGAGYGFGNMAARQGATGDTDYPYQSAIPCYSEATAGNEERVLSLSPSSRSRPCAVNTMGRRTSGVSNGADHPALVGINTNHYHDYEAGALSSFHGVSMDRSADMYTTAPPTDDFGQGNSLRPPLPGYPYRYTDMASDRGQDGESMTAVEYHPYSSHGRGAYFDAASPTAADHMVGRGNSSAGLHG